MVQRWTLYDPLLDDTYVFPVNPNAMSTPHAPRSLSVITTAPRVGGPSVQGRVVELNAEPYEWQFSGYVRTEDHHDQLRAWTRKVNRLVLTDHFEREWSIRMVALDLDEKRPRALQPWRFDYTIKAINYGLVA